MTAEEKFEAFINQYESDARANGYAHFNIEHLEDLEESRAEAKQPTRARGWGGCTSAPLARS